MVSGNLEIEPIWSALGRDKAPALPVFHPFTAADNAEGFSGHGKTKWFQQYISALIKLTEEGDLTPEVWDALANFVYLLYCPKGIHITSIPDLRWHLFCKYPAESSKLPPTVGAFDGHIERVRVQSRVWCQASMMWQHLFDPLKHGYFQYDHGDILPTTEVPPAPQVIVELVRCRCKAHCTTQSWSDVGVKPIAQPRVGQMSV